MLYHLSYVSNENTDITSNDLKNILDEARNSNEKNDITGLLLYRDKSFLQVLEGEKEKVLETFVKIERDYRHKDVEVLFSEPFDEREFTDWSMAFTNLNDIAVNEVPGFSDFLINDTQPREFLKDLTRSKRTLLLFRSMN